MNELTEALPSTADLTTKQPKQNVSRLLKPTYVEMNASVIMIASVDGNARPAETQDIPQNDASGSYRHGTSVRYE